MNKLAKKKWFFFAALALAILSFPAKRPKEISLIAAVTGTSLLITHSAYA